MRIVFVGASSLALMAAKQLLDGGHEVVIIEAGEQKLEELSETLDCGLVHGDGTRPRVLREISPENTDFLFCLGESDRDNIISALVGQTMDFGRVIAKIEDPDFESVCVELGLQDIIIPDRQVAGELVDMVEGKESSHLVAMMKGGVRFFSFVAREEDAGMVQELSLPGRSRVIAITREERTSLVGGETKIREGDEVVVITEEEHLDALKDRFAKS